MLRQLVTRRILQPAADSLRPTIMADASKQTVNANRSRKRPASSFHSQRRPTPAKRPANAAPATSSSFSTTATLSETLFKDLKSSNIHPDLLKSVIVGKGLLSMTTVQAETLPVTLARQDVLAQARTGTGKTIAFLLPGIQRLLDTRPLTSGSPRGPAAAPRQTSLVVITPTRELALQIAVEAEQLLKGLTSDSGKQSPYKVLTAIGGTNANAGVKRLREGCDILIATPGRLLDYMQDERCVSIVQGVQTLVLDEADRLLDMGFIRDIQKFVDKLPDRAKYDRQSMLFSATMDANAQKVANIVLKKGYKAINTVPEGEKSTHERVSQRLITVDSFADLAPAVFGAMLKDRDSFERPQKYKAILFLPTAAHVDLFRTFLDALQFENRLPLILHMHGRLAQGKRTTSSASFREADSAILIATDVIARGMDFPNVTHVYQAGLPDDKASYIHRLGRTARAGAEGNGTLILTRDEMLFANKNLREIDFNSAPSEFNCEWPEARRAMEQASVDAREKSYRALLGYYGNKIKTLGYTPQVLVAKLNEFALKGLYLSQVPGLEKRLAGKLRLRGVPGVRIIENRPA